MESSPKARMLYFVETGSRSAQITDSLEIWRAGIGFAVEIRRSRRILGDAKSAQLEGQG